MGVYVFMNAEKILLINDMARHNTSHLAHFILTVLTGGVWVIVWIIVALSNAKTRDEIMEEILGLEESDHD